MRTTIERELKLEPGTDFVLPELPGEPIEPRLFTSTYYDTPTRSLTRSGLTLRRRLENGRSLWQLKLPRDEARAEIEAPGGPAGPPDEIKNLLVAHLRHGKLRPVATLRTRRSGVRVTDGERRVAEVTVDSVDVLDGGRAAGHFDELEIELLAGEPAELTSLGRVLRRAGASASDGRPKVMRVLGPAAGAADEQDETTLGRLRSVLDAQVRELERYDPGVRLGDDAEDLHRFRVATRRTRAIVRATQPLVGAALAPLAAELKWLGGLLGPVRDLDVLLERLADDADDLGPDEAAAGALIAILAADREGLRRELIEGLDSPRYLELLAAFETAIASLPALDGAGTLVEVAAAELGRLRKAAKALPPVPTDHELHALRIRAKRARYAAELAATERPGRRLKRYVDALKDLQDVVGDHQDSVVAEERLRHIARAKTAVAAGRLIERERERRGVRRTEVPKALRRVLERGAEALA